MTVEDDVETIIENSNRLTNINDREMNLIKNEMMDIRVLTGSCNIPLEKYSDALDEVIEDILLEVTDEDWIERVSFERLLKELLVFHSDVDPHSFAYLFKKYTNYSISEIKEMMETHAELYNYELDIMYDYL